MNVFTVNKKLAKELKKLEKKNAVTFHATVKEAQALGRIRKKTSAFKQGRIPETNEVVLVKKKMIRAIREYKNCCMFCF